MPGTLSILSGVLISLGARAGAPRDALGLARNQMKKRAGRPRSQRCNPRHYFIHASASSAHSLPAKYWIVSPIACRICLELAPRQAGVGSALPREQRMDFDSVYRAPESGSADRSPTVTPQGEGKPSPFVGIEAALDL